METPIHLGAFAIEIQWTPGHTQGSVCVLIEEHLFVGDTIFRGKIGRVDLPGGNQSNLSQSLKRLSIFPPDTKIYPGHGPISTIGYELCNNKDFIEALHED